MYSSKTFELPDELQGTMKKARRLEWVTIIFLISEVGFMYLVVGSSQAMKAAWLEDALSLLPAIFFLIASKIYDKSPNSTFPYGYHRVFSIAFMAGSLSLFAMGIFLLVDSGIVLLTSEHPTIGSVKLFGRQIWLGWLMIGVLFYTVIPAVILGYKKLPLSKALHNKILHNDASAQKADYLTAIAAIIGIVGIGLGFWWADAIAAIVISVSVLHDGITQLKTAILDLMDRHPVHINDHQKDELVEEIENYIQNWPWVLAAKVRFREHGQVYFGEVYVVPNSSTDLLTHIEKGVADLKEYNWKIYDVVIYPVSLISNE